jgi:tetratricopeptide (TPR) repeat protein
MYAILGEYKPAEEFLKRSLAAHQDAQGFAAVARAVVQSELATVYGKTHRYSEADPLFQQALQVVDSVEHGVPVGCALVLSRSGDYEMSRHNWQAAESEYRRALKLREATVGDQPIVAASLTALSQALQKLHRKQEAKNCRERAAQILAVQKHPLNIGQTIDVRAFRASR